MGHVPIYVLAYKRLEIWGFLRNLTLVMLVAYFRFVVVLPEVIVEEHPIYRVSVTAVFI